MTLAASPSRRRAIALFANFFFIILAYYQVKAASRSLLIEYGGSGSLPYAWVYSALTLVAVIAAYHVIVERYERVRVVLGSLLAFATLLVLFRTVFTPDDLVSATAFYVFVDIFSVVLVEQFWSLTDSVSSTEEGRRSFWFVGTGGLVGGVCGGLLASALVSYTRLETPDLLYACALLLIVVWGFNLHLHRAGLYAEVRDAPRAVAGDWRVLLHNRYLLLIALLLCCSQLAQPIVEFQFLNMAEQAYPVLDARTAFISQFFSVLGVASIAVNLVVTPIMHRVFGAIGGLALQPVVLGACAVLFHQLPSLGMASVMKIADRGLSYSVNRASKELLYIPVDPVSTYQAKAWIDMVGYRLFKAIGSGMILLAVHWLPAPAVAARLSWLTLAVCAMWMFVIARIAHVYRAALARA